ncbi:MAG TPA: prepilin-type N-terminal cleavage/methylation domain-containing protein [Longimicrobium sp.]|nr:prepilin-type N-terminal cleavage/methylation domain-containing protein [Longimicrobium sp.]
MSFDRQASERGFTLIEVLVALVLASLLAGVIFQVVRGQARFASVQSAQQEVQQNARGAVEIIASELRAAQDSGLVEGYGSSITFLLPRAWGVSCGGTTSKLNVVFPTVPDTSIMWALNGASGVVADTSTVAGTPAWGPIPSTNMTGAAKVTSISAQNPVLGAANNACADSVRTDSTSARVRGRALNGTGLPTVRKGNSVYLYQLVRYDVGTVNGEYWVRRSNGIPGADPQPLAGPIRSDSALAFTYYKADGTAFSPGNTLAQLRLVARIGVKVVAHSRTKGRAELNDSVQTSVLLRN